MPLTSQTHDYINNTPVPKTILDHLRKVGLTDQQIAANERSRQAWVEATRLADAKRVRERLATLAERNAAVPNGL